MNRLLKFIAIAFLATSTFSIASSYAEGTVSKGTFVGKSNHVTKGNVEVIKAADGSYKVILASNFSLDGAPDPKLAFGKNGVDKSTIFAPLQSKTGKQEYSLPAGIDPTKYNEIYVWCEKFSVPLGVASLN